MNKYDLEIEDSEDYEEKEKSEEEDAFMKQ